MSKRVLLALLLASVSVGCGGDNLPAAPSAPVAPPPSPPIWTATLTIEDGDNEPWPKGEEPYVCAADEDLLYWTSGFAKFDDATTGALEPDTFEHDGQPYAVTYVWMVLAEDDCPGQSDGLLSFNLLSGNETPLPEDGLPWILHVGGREYPLQMAKDRRPFRMGRLQRHDFDIDFATAPDWDRLGGMLTIMLTEE